MAVWLTVCARPRACFFVFYWQSVQLYWVTSATFGLLQSWALDYWDMRRRSRVAPPAPGGDKAAQ